MKIKIYYKVTLRQVSHHCHRFRSTSRPTLVLNLRWLIPTVEGHKCVTTMRPGSLCWKAGTRNKLPTCRLI